MLLVLKLFQNIMLQKWKFLFILLSYAVHVHCKSYLCVSDDPNEAISLLVHNNNSNVQVLRPVNSEFQINLVKDEKDLIITPNYSYESLILDRRWENFPQIKENFSTSSKTLSLSVSIENKAELIVNINETQKILLTIKASETHSKCETSNTTITLYTNQTWSHFQILNDNENLTVILKNINCTLNNLNLGENMTVSIDSKSTWILHNLSYYSLTADTVNLENNEKPNYTQVSFFLKTTLNGTISTVQGLNSCITVKPSEDWQFITMEISELGLSFDFDNEWKRTSLSGIYLSNHKVPRIINYTSTKNEEMVYCDSTKFSFIGTSIEYNNECMVNYYEYCIDNCIICCKGKCYVLPYVSTLMKLMYSIIMFIIFVPIFGFCVLSGKYWHLKRKLRQQQPNFPESQVNLGLNTNVIDNKDFLTKNKSQVKSPNETLQIPLLNNYEEIPVDQARSSLQSDLTSSKLNNKRDFQKEIKINDSTSSSLEEEKNYEEIPSPGIGTDYTVKKNVYYKYIPTNVSVNKIHTSSSSELSNEDSMNEKNEKRDEKYYKFINPFKNTEDNE